MKYFTNKKLQEALAMKHEFICVASHELKTPLTALKLQVEMAKRVMDNQGVDAISPGKVRSIINRTHQDVLRLSRLVDDLLDASRINSGKFTMKYEYFNLEDFLEDFTQRMSHQKIRMTIHAPVMVKWDKFRVEQVIINLLNNAFRYGNGSEVDLDVSTGGNLVFIKVRDYGPGISPECQKKIFARFECGDMDRATEGLGLGLYISQEIIKHHNGKIVLSSALGKGSTFELQIPIS